MASPVIETDELCKTYRDGTEAVRSVTFSVDKGEIFGLLGPNGAGKTTTMRILGTLHRATGGAATVLGLDVHKDAARLRQRIGFAMQEVGMDDLATAHEMLMLHGRLYGMNRATAADRAASLLDMFGLSEHADRRVTRFSGGMQRRLDLAVSLMHEPEVLFLDEPSTGLDPKSRQELWQILRRLRRDHGLTILLSTHYMDEADALCDRIAVMAKGEIAALGTPSALKAALGPARLQVTVRKAPTQAVATTLTKKLGAAVRGDRIDVPLSDRDLLPSLQSLDKAGLQVVSTRIVEPTLDDVFLRHTGAPLQEDA